MKSSGSFLKGILVLIFTFILFLVFTLIASTVIIAIGYFISKYTVLSHFESSLISLGTALVIVIWFWNAKQKDNSWDHYEDDSWDEVDEENDYDDEIGYNNHEKLHSHDTPISRNAPCPCGSGKKYKHCCGR